MTILQFHAISDSRLDPVQEGKSARKDIIELPTKLEDEWQIKWKCYVKVKSTKICSQMTHKKCVCAYTCVQRENIQMIKQMR